MRPRGRGSGAKELGFEKRGSFSAENRAAGAAPGNMEHYDTATPQGNRKEQAGAETGRGLEHTHSCKSHATDRI